MLAHLLTPSAHAPTTTKDLRMTQADIPLPDDALSAGAIESRIRSLDVAELRRVLAYEQEHADRPQVVLILEHRLTALETGEAEPVPGDPMAPLPS